MSTATRCFDLFCVGKYKQGSDLKLNIQSADKIPSLITKDSNGAPVFAEPKPMCTIRSPKGHNVWIKIDLQAITTGVSNYIALGIKKQHEDNYFDILYTGKLSRYVDVLETDTVELIPLVSSTPLSVKYTAIKVGDTAKITSENAYDFGSVYRINITLDDAQTITYSCDLSKINSTLGWYCNGTVGVGDLMCEDGQLRESQLLIINVNGQLARSSNGIHWFDIGSVRKGNEGAGKNNSWQVHPAFGNGIWCVINWDNTLGVRRSMDYGKTWSETMANVGARTLNFADGVFMVVTDKGLVYTSSDAECWSQIGSVPYSGERGKVLIHGNDRWIFGTQDGVLYWSENGKENWKFLDSNLSKLLVGDDEVYGGCYDKGYFYVSSPKNGILRSPDGTNWDYVVLFTSTSYNVTFYKNKLLAFSGNDSTCTVGLFNSGGIN